MVDSVLFSSTRNLLHTKPQICTRAGFWGLLKQDPTFATFPESAGVLSPQDRGPNPGVHPAKDRSRFKMVFRDAYIE